MAPPTLLVARTALRERLSEPTAAAWTDTELNRFLNEGCREIAIRTEYIATRADLNVTAGIYQMNLSVPLNDVLRVHRAEWINTQSLTGSDQIYPLRYAQINNLDSIRGSGQETSRGIPSLYSMWGANTYLNVPKIILYPRPSANGILRIWYYGLPYPATADGDSLPCPEGWEHLVYDYAEFRAKVKDGDQSWQVAKNDFEMRLTEFKNMFSRLTDENDSIGIDAWYGPNYGDDLWSF